MRVVYEAKQHRLGKVFSGMPKETVAEAIESFFFLNSINIDFEQNILVEKYTNDGRCFSRENDDWFWYYNPNKL